MATALNSSQAYYVNTLRQRIIEELRLLDLQLEKSRRVRGSCAPPCAEAPSPSVEESGGGNRVDSSAAASPVAATLVAPPAAVAANPATREETSPLQKQSEGQQVKRGTLVSYGRKRFLQKFESRYVSVEPNCLSWWESEAAFQKQPQKPLDTILFSSTTTNSRGSTFKKCAKCWPVVTLEDCKEAKDPSLAYFGVGFLNAKLDNELLVLAASTPAERKEWIFFITKYIALFLAPRPESAEFVDTPVGSAKPLHVDCVLDGEAPGGNF